jgi:MFS family permease
MHKDIAFDWRTIAALNLVSTLAQVGQFGIAFVMLPVWLAAQGLDATQLGMFAASLWLGQLPGLAAAPWLCTQLGPRRVIVSGLLCTVLALGLIALTGWPWWPVGGALAGFGLGLRWIGLEPWLYRIAPAEARGRLVGFHETLIALAPIVAPLLAGYTGLQGNGIFEVGITFTVAALLPLALARAPADEGPTLLADASRSWRAAPVRDFIFKQGIIIALLGGMLEAAVSGLFAPFALGRAVSVDQTADLLAVFGLGGLLMQYAIGWLADHGGLRTAGQVSALGAAAVACLLTLVPAHYTLMLIAVFLMGGFITAFLTLALIASTTTTTGSMARNVSTISMLYTASAIAGPLLAGAAMQATRSDALMWFTAVVAVGMAVALGIQPSRPAVNQPP